VGYRLNSLQAAELRKIKGRLNFALIVLACLLVITVAAGAKFLFSDPPQPTPTPTVMVLPVGPAGKNPDPKLGLQCFRATQQFAESEWEECEPVDECKWSLAKFRFVEGSGLGRELSSDDLDAAYPAYVLGTHNATPVRSGPSLDSNFELSSKRANHVVAALASELKFAVPVPLAALPEPCLRDLRETDRQDSQHRLTPAVMLLFPMKAP
jgi:hypothetical protein